jgi:hypothetical protein
MLWSMKARALNAQFKCTWHKITITGFYYGFVKRIVLCKSMFRKSTYCIGQEQKNNSPLKAFLG